MHRVNWKQVTVEFIAISFGVFLGLFLNEWRESARQAAIVDRTFTAMETELVENFELVEVSREYHIALLPRLRNVVDGEITFEDVGFRGMRPPRVQTAAWQLAIQRGVLADADEDKVLGFVSAYTSLEALSELYSIYSSASVSNINQMGADEAYAAQFIAAAFVDFLYGTDEVMQKIGDITPKEVPPEWWQSFEQEVAED